MEILTAAQMYAADKETIAKIMPENDLVENAGFAAACQIAKRYGKQPILVACGAGNNGADGFVAARVLSNRGYSVKVAFAGQKDKMSPACRFAAERFDGLVTPLSPDCLRGFKGVVVDALFGIGLSRPIEGEPAAFIAALNASSLPVVSLDIPSGVFADTGAVSSAAVKADLTVTFCRPKPAHFLYPAKEYVGDLIVCPIGITDEIVANRHPRFIVNPPFNPPAPTPYDHKYSRGAVLVAGGEMTGAARLAAGAARRFGAGLVKVICAPEKALSYSVDAAGLVVSTEPLEAAATDKKISAIAFGMGFGLSEKTKAALQAVVKSGKPFVADADALACIKDFAPLTNAVITPHEGEFSRLFPDLTGDKLSRALFAAEALGCVVVLKGADTVIAAPDGRAAIDADTSFCLATAGSGDVLSGIIAAMLAKHIPPFEAACAGVFLHSQAGIRAGANPIAEDLIRE